MPEPNSPFCELMSFVRNTMHLGKLHQSMKIWLEDKSGKSDLNFRFTGNESRKCCHNVHNLIRVINVPGRSPQERQKLHALSSIMTHLRDATALFSRYSISDEQLNSLERHCEMYFTGCRIFLSSLPVSTWTIGHAVPAYAREMKAKYGFGLGLGTAQGREGKVLHVKRYAQHALLNDMFTMIFAMSTWH